MIDKAYDILLSALCDGAELKLCKLFQSASSISTAMDRILRLFAPERPKEFTPSASLGSQAFDAWLRTDAYLQYETNESKEIDPGKVRRTMGTIESLVQHDSDRESNPVSNLISWRISLFQSLTFCRLTQGCEAELTPHCAVPKVSSNP